MDVNTLLCNENLFYANCIATNALISSFSVIENKILLDGDDVVDFSNLADICHIFLVEHDGSQYGGGEALNHGSYGFFYKKTGHVLDWALMSLESNPFVQVRICEKEARFSASSGLIWIVPSNEIAKVYIDLTPQTLEDLEKP